MNDPEQSDEHDRVGQRHQVEPAPRWVKIFGAVVVALLLAFIAMHLAGGGFRGHGP